LIYVHLLMTSYVGELAALAAAVIWAGASVVYTAIGRQLSPLMLNLLKGLIAIAFLILTLALTGQLIPAIEGRAVWLLVLSGLFGIGVGDTAYFMALNQIGARRALVLESLSPPLTALLAWAGLGERLSLISWLGIGLTVAGVLWVVLEGRADGREQTAEGAIKADGREQDVGCVEHRETHRKGEAHRKDMGMGIVCGLVAAVGQGVGAVLSRSALAGSEIHPLWSSLIRLAAGGVVLLTVVLAQQKVAQELQPLRSRRLFGTIVGAAFASTFLAISLQQVSLKYAPAGIAQALSATSPLFVIPIVMAMGERVSRRAIVGVLGAIAGMWLLFVR
jgi:drug/metabolite transporter (DMT)-like permease